MFGYDLNSHQALRKKPGLDRHTTDVYIRNKRRHSNFQRLPADYNPSNSSRSRPALSMPKRKQIPFRILDLPGELRMRIYTYALQGTQDQFFMDHKSRRVMRVHIHDQTGLGISHDNNILVDIRHPQGINSNLLRSCKQVYQEAKDLIVELNTFNLGIENSLPHVMTHHYQLENGPKRSNEVMDLWPFWSRIRHLEVSARLWEHGWEHTFWVPAVVKLLNAHPQLVIHNLNIDLHPFYPSLEGPNTAISQLEKLRMHGPIIIESRAHMIHRLIGSRPESSVPKMRMRTQDDNIFYHDFSEFEHFIGAHGVSMKEINGLDHGRK